jgi:mitochondrial fission 1 protein
MGRTVARQKQVKEELDTKLALSRPDTAILEELAIGLAQNPTPTATFQYAFALSKSAEPSELRYAVNLLDGLIIDGFEHQVDCMYGAATALYLLGDYEEARVSRIILWHIALRCVALLHSHVDAIITAVSQ